MMKVVDVSLGGEAPTALPRQVVVPLREGMLPAIDPETLDTAEEERKDESMSTPSREEFDLHIRLLDQRMEGHFSLLDERLKGQSDLFEQWRTGQAKVADERDERLTKAIGDIKTESAAARVETENQAKSLKTVLITTAIVAVIAIVGGIAAFNATVLSNMTASFESGKNTATAIVQATDALQKTQDQLKEAVDRLPKTQSPPKQ